MRAETARSIHHSSIEFFSGDAAAIKELCATTCGMGISGGVFFICPAEGTGSGMGRIRAVSFFGPDDGDSGAGVTDADNGGENEGAVTGRENWLEARFAADAAAASVSAGA